MKKIYNLIFVLLCINFASAQNLVNPNPGFETASPCPTAANQLPYASPWNRGWETPDLFHTCGSVSLASYTSATGAARITANTGNGMMGLFCYNSIGAALEYAVVQLSSPMAANTLYTVSFYARVANLARFRFSIDRIGCYFTSTNSAGVNYSGGGIAPQVVTPAGSFFSTTWTRYTMTFTTPSSGAALQYLTIGNFRSLDSTSTSLLTSLATSTSGSAYIFFDDFDVRPTVVLPVELFNFSAKCLTGSNAVQLIWSTATEINNKEFIVERSTDAINFEPINSVLGNGNSTAINTYQVIDNSIDLNVGGIFYYRLKQVDFDGRIKFSNIISVNYCDIDTDSFEMYPNPTGGILYLNNTKELKSIEIFNSIGQVVVFETIDNTKETLDLSILSNGLYFLKVVDLNNKTIERKLVKQ